MMLGPRKSRGNRRSGRVARLLLAAAATLLSASLGSASRAQEGALEDGDCLICHGAMEGETFALGDGSTLDLYVDEERWGHAAHNGEVPCTGCHTGIEDYPHPDVEAQSAEAYRSAAAEQCNRCHYEYFTRFLDSMHYSQLTQGNEEAPNCVDCHGAHGPPPSAEPRIAIDHRCGSCHEEVSAAYLSSVHGSALSAEDTTDVPVCTDCHGAHDIIDPREPTFHVSSHEVCARCHGDQELMRQYGLNPYVLTTYLEDFHGSSNLIYASDGEAPDEPMATCTDCHGVHDIQSFHDGDAATSVRERIAVRCQSCHEGANVNFADAWLSHYPPTLASAPMVWGVKWVYRILIPLIIAGLLLHIFLHLRQVAMQRRRRGGASHG